MGLLKDTNKNWQPQDFLPDPESEQFFDEIKGIQERSKGISDDLMVVLVGDLITEEALPTYMNMLNTLEETKDTTGADGTPWAEQAVPEREAEREAARHAIKAKTASVATSVTFSPARSCTNWKGSGESVVAST